MEKLSEERSKKKTERINAALNLRDHDRVPLEIAFGYFPAKYNGITCKPAYYDCDTWLKACIKTIMDYNKVDIPSTQPYSPGEVLEILDPQSFRWPGHNSPENHGHQYVEGEFMKADEYPVLLGNPMDFSLRYYLPRVIRAMNGFEIFPSLSGHEYGYQIGISIAEAFANPELDASIEKLRKAGKKMMEAKPRIDKFEQGIAKLGFPQLADRMGIAPFDAISDHLRGMQGSMLDMYRQPDILLEACDAILKGMLERMPPHDPDSLNRVMIPLHRGSAGFMSIQQFEKFYWPGLKGYILGLIERGYTPLVFFEGDYTDRLEYLLELPKGEVFTHMDMTDIFRAAEVLSGHLCFSGNLPCSLLKTGTVDDVKEATKMMLKACTKNGGFIMSSRSPVDDAKPDTLKAFIDTTVEYGRY
jgi:hypothetical protein